MEICIHLWFGRHSVCFHGRPGTVKPPLFVAVTWLTQTDIDLSSFSSSFFWLFHFCSLELPSKQTICIQVFISCSVSSETQSKTTSFNLEHYNKWWDVKMIHPKCSRDIGKKNKHGPLKSLSSIKAIKILAKNVRFSFFRTLKITEACSNLRSAY